MILTPTWPEICSLMPKAPRAGFGTHWTTYGQGPREALMIHCSLASSEAWGGLARVLSGALTMTAFDMPGHGRSDDWDNRGEIQGVTAEIAADFLEGPADVIGHSFGAMVALRLAVERPELVRTLTLIEPVFFAVAIADQPDVTRARTMQMAGFEEAMRHGDYVEAARAFTDIWGDGIPYAAMGDVQQRQLAEQMPLVAAAAPAIFDDVARLLDPERSARVAMPVLIIEGTVAPPIISTVCHGLEWRLSDATRAIVAGAGHMAPLTHAGAVGAEILQFLRLHPPG